MIIKKNKHFGALGLRRLSTLFLCGAVAMTMMTGCKKESAVTEEKNPDELVYVSEYIPIEMQKGDEFYYDYNSSVMDGDKLSILKIGQTMDDNTCYVDEFDIRTGKLESEIRIGEGIEQLIDVSSEVPEKYKDSAKYGSNINFLTGLPDGGYAGVVNSYWYDETAQEDEGGWGGSTYLGIFDNDGKVLNAEKLDFSPMFGNMTANANAVMNGKNGTIVVIAGAWSENENKSAGLIFDRQCNCIDWKMLPIMQFESCFTDPDGGIGLIYFDENWNMKVCGLNMDDLSLGKEYEGFADEIRCVAVQDDKLLCATYSKLISYDPATGEKADILEWKNLDVKEGIVRKIAVLDGEYYVLTQDWDTESTDLVRIAQKKRGEIIEREELVIASLYDDYDLNNKIIEFNKANPNYHITLNAYHDWSKEDADPEDSRKTMINDITGSNTPDMINLREISVRNLVKQGVLEDLSPYINESSVVKLEELNEKVLDNFRFDDKLVAIPRCFSLSTIVVNKDDFGDRAGWTLSEMIEYDKANPEGSITSFTDRISLMHMCLYQNIDSFIDYETGECRFDSDEFKELLEYIASYPAEFDYSGITSYSPAEELANGKILTQVANLYGIRDIQEYDSYLFAGKADFIGYPTLDGTPTAVLDPNMVFGICSSSEKKDIAWKFMEFCLGEEFTENDMGLPTNKKQMQALVDKELENAGKKANSSIGWGDGDMYDFHYSTREEIDKLYEILDQAKYYGVANDQLIAIIEEETGSFFEGQKSVDECAKIIQSRISLFVQENGQN